MSTDLIPAAMEEVVAQIVANDVLDTFELRLADLREQYACQTGEENLPTSIAQARHRLRKRDQDIEIARVAARLAREGFDVGRPRTEPDGTFHTIDPRVSFAFCSTCGGSVITVRPCHLGGAA